MHEYDQIRITNAHTNAHTKKVQWGIYRTQIQPKI